MPTDEQQIKKILDYLHLYLGAEFQLIEDYTDGMITFKSNDRLMLTVDVLNQVEHGWMKGKPILRPLSDMSEEEMKECGCLTYDFSDEEDLMNWEWQDFQTLLSVEQFLWLLSKHFDLFNLIAEGLAIDAATLKQ